MLAGLALAGLAGCGNSPAEAPSVLLVTVDCLRSDHVGAYGYGRDTTPNLDALAAESALFERSYSHAPFTAPSHASLLTGLNTPSHGLVFWNYKIDPAAQTFQDLFGAAGYRTSAFINHPGLPPTGLLEDFDLPSTQLSGPWEDTVEHFFDWVDSGEGKFATWVHLWDVHRPFGYREWSAELLGFYPGTGRQPGRLPFAESGFGPGHDVRVGRLEAHYNVNPTERAGPLPVGAEQRRLGELDWRYIADRYDNGIRFADRGVGALIEGLRERGVLDDTLVVITADHGESLTERDAVWFTHDPFLYEETLRVPLVIRFPGGRFAGQREGELLVRGIDVLPTLLDVSGLDAPAALQGRSLVGVLDGSDRQPVTLLAQTQTKSAKESFRSVVKDEAGPDWLEFRQAVTDGRHKLILDYDTGTLELYDLSSDPGEVHNLVVDNSLDGPGLALRDELQRYRSELPAAPVHVVDPDIASQALLDALGYVEKDPAGEQD
ncbi:Arylsulfatase [Planctomycetes bacterium Pla86]|uniref:Arylsulfatase n=2 Tax=Engelhardtia mirabilis TaxID=2528011 RepID=A0A518BM07_9BACT|nr:Arylsulfatase [Planctomycetes bacterium Pla133]QDV02336.1 Arylsulfatase [Planctomycetes bacterium Pla86]